MRPIFFLASILTTVIILPAYGVDISELENVGLKTKYIIISNGQEFKIEAVSNFQIISHTFSETDKILTFNVQTARDTGNESEFYIPKEMLVEPLTVLLDGQKISALINKVDNKYNQLIYYSDPAIVCDATCQANDPQAQMQVALATMSAQHDATNDPSTTSIVKVEATLEELEQVISMPPVKYAPEVISEQNAFLVREMLNSNIWGEPGKSYGTGWRAKVLKRRDIGGKTGTTNNAKDGWYTGFGPNIVATTWVGFDDHRRSLGRTSRNSNLGKNQIAGSEFGGNAAQPTWINFMHNALKNTPEQDKQIPDDIIKVRIDRATGQLSNQDGASSMYEYFIQGTEPTRSVQQAVSEREFDTDTAEELF